jgi:hypothetical protein
MTGSVSKYAFDYRGLGKASSFGRFREEIGRKVQHLDIEPHVDHEIEITANVVEVPGVLTMQGACTAPVSFRRTPELLRDGANGVVVVCPSPDPVRLKIGGGDGVLAPNHVGVWDQARVGEMQNVPGSPKVLIHVCRHALTRSNRNLERQLAERGLSSNADGQSTALLCGTNRRQSRHTDCGGERFVGPACRRYGVVDPWRRRRRR